MKQHKSHIEKNSEHSDSERPSQANQASEYDNLKQKLTGYYETVTDALRNKNTEQLKSDLTDNFNKAKDSEVVHVVEKALGSIQNQIISHSDKLIHTIKRKMKKSSSEHHKD